MTNIKTVVSPPGSPRRVCTLLSHLASFPLLS